MTSTRRGAVARHRITDAPGATVPVWSSDPAVVTAASVLGLSRRLAYAGAADGSLPVVRFGARLVVPVDALAALLDSRSSGIGADPRSADGTDGPESTAGSTGDRA